MQHYQEYLHSLLFEKIAGTISEKDEQLILRELAVNEELQAAWDDIQEKLGTHENRVFLNDIDDAAAWEQVNTRMENDDVLVKKSIPFYLRFKKPLTAAAIVILISTVGLYIYQFSINSNKGDKGVVKNAIDTSQSIPGAIQLILADGRVLKMGEEKVAFSGAQVAVSGDSGGMNYHSLSPANNEWTTLLVPETKDYKITLDDGSQVWLNSRSSIRFPVSFSNNKREVFIEGEAYFKITHDAARPFIVHAIATDIEVLGTSFNVNTYNRDSITTSLVEGAVKNRAGDKIIYLKPGLQSFFNERTGFSMQAFDEKNVLSWMSGICYFRSQELKQLSGLLKRWFNVDIVFENSIDESHKLTGYINKNQPIERFMSNLEKSSGIKSRLSGNKLIIE